MPVEVTPDPIPNSEVKLNRADGTAGFACGRVGSRQDRGDKTIQKSEFRVLNLIQD